MEVLSHPRRTAAQRGALCGLWILGALAAVAPSLAAQSYSEDSVKAAYLYRFTQYIDWPRPPGPGRPFTIAVLNAPAVAQELQRLLPDHLIKNSPARVRPITRIQDMGDAQMLYLGPAPADRLRNAIASVAFSPVLLVTDSEEGLELGGVLNFITVDRRVRFEVSLTAADRSQLRISSELLAVAARVLGGSRQTYEFAPDPATVSGD